MDSIWRKNVTLPEFPPLEGQRHTDVAVVGGGLAGILAAHLLRQEGCGVIVLEAGRVGSGQTGGTTAKLTAQHGLKYHTLIRTLGVSAAEQYARANLRAVTNLRQLCREWNIACDFWNCSTFLYATGTHTALAEEYAACRRLGMDVFLTKQTELPFPAQALGLRRQACFHPLKLLAALCEGLTVYEHSRVLHADGRSLYTARGCVTAEAVLFTCHYPFVNVPGFYFLRQHQERSYVLALEGAAEMQDCWLGVDGEALSFRPCGRYLLLGGGAHRTGENPGGQYERLEQAARRYWPECQVVSRWSAQDCIPMDGVPYIGQFAGSRGNWFVATGFQKWGMSSSMVAAECLRDLAMGRTPPAGSALFSPRRFHAAASARQLTDDTVHAVRGLSRRFLEPGRIPASRLPPGHGGVVELNGEKLGVYRDEQGALFAVSAACPHLGCQLEWNPDEKSWDCPCHGSRFDIHGRLLDGPARTAVAKR